MYVYCFFVWLCWVRKEMSKWGSDWIFEGSLKIIWICCLGRIFNDIDEYIVMYGLK